MFVIGSHSISDPLNISEAAEVASFDAGVLATMSGIPAHIKQKVQASMMLGKCMFPVHADMVCAHWVSVSRGFFFEAMQSLGQSCKDR